MKHRNSLFLIPKEFKKMSCRFASSNPQVPVYAFSKCCDQFPTKSSVVPEEISFTSQMTKSRITMRKPSGPRRTRAPARIRGFYQPTETRETLYQLLGIDETGSCLSDIKRAYKQMARKYHPDVAPPDRVDEHTRRFVMVKEAYDTLSNPQKRALYDRDLAMGVGFGLSARRVSYQYDHDQRMEERGEWRIRWESQLAELKKRSMNPHRGRMSWAARMRNTSR